MIVIRLLRIYLKFVNGEVTSRRGLYDLASLSKRTQYYTSFSAYTALNPKEDEDESFV